MGRKTETGYTMGKTTKLRTVAIAQGVHKASFLFNTWMKSSRDDERVSLMVDELWKIMLETRCSQALSVEYKIIDSLNILYSLFNSFRP